MRAFRRAGTEVRTLLAAALAVLLLSSPTSSQSLLKSEIAARSRTAGGKISGCAIEFTMLYRDHTYQRGALAGVTGSLEWMVSNRDDFFLAFKVVGADPNRDLNGWQSFHVPHAFVGARGALYPADRTVECEDQAAYCGFYGGSKAVAILGILTDDPTNVTVNFNRRTDGLDISLPLAVSPEDHLQHSTCMVQILEQAKAAVQ